MEMGFTEIQNGRHGSTSIFLRSQKLKKLVVNLSILQSYSPRYGDVHVIFQGFTEIQNGRHA